jgi:hypothetical protein
MTHFVQCFIATIQSVIANILLQICQYDLVSAKHSAVCRMEFVIPPYLKPCGMFYVSVRAACT